MTSQCLASDKVLVLEACQRIARPRQQQHNPSSDQAAGLIRRAHKLHDSHDSIYGRPHVVGGESSNEGIELGRGRADAKQ